MPRVVVDVMLKPEILDPQGKAVHGALTRLGLSGLTDVRQGKQFVLAFDGELDEARWELIDKLAAELLSNPVIEDYQLSVIEDETGGCCGGSCDCAPATAQNAGGDANCCGGACDCGSTQPAPVVEVTEAAGGCCGGSCGCGSGDASGQGTADDADNPLRIVQ